MAQERLLTYVNAWVGDSSFRGVKRTFAEGLEVYRLESHGGTLG